MAARRSRRPLCYRPVNKAWLWEPSSPQTPAHRRARTPLHQEGSPSTRPPPDTEGSGPGAGKAAADDGLHDLAGAAIGRLDAAEPPYVTAVPEGSGQCSRPSRPGSVWSVRTAAFAPCDLGGDHAPRDRLTTSQLPEPRRGPDDHAEPAAADIPAGDADVDSGELITASCHRSS